MSSYQNITDTKVSVFAIIEENSEIFVTTRPEDKKCPFGLPGGKVDKGESLLEALKREVFEEGIDIDVSNAVLVNKSHVDDGYVYWYFIKSKPTLLTEYKEKYRGIEVQKKTIDEVSKSGYGNSFIKELF